MILKEKDIGKMKYVLVEENGVWLVSSLLLENGGPYMGYEIEDTRLCDTLNEAQEIFETLTKKED